jgi:putative Mg2+ transporter-C (MgtC) family protein
MDWYEQLALMGHLAGAMALGAVLGIQRQRHDKPAGLRTHMLVAGASALFTMLGMSLALKFRNAANLQASGADPIRILHAIVIGIGFLGAGTIVRRGGDEHVEGLTTAASILMAAAIGIAVALEEYPLALAAALLGLVTLSVFGTIETRSRRILKKKQDTKPLQSPEGKRPEGDE